MPRIEYLDLDNAHTFWCGRHGDPIMGERVDNGVHEPATGLNPKGVISASDALANEPIHPDLEKTLPNRAPGVWAESVTGEKLTEHLAAYDGQDVFSIVYDTAKEFREVQKLRVRRARPGG